MAPPRVLLIDAAPDAERFSAAARQLMDDGFDIELATEIRPTPFPLICGRGRASETAALRRSYAVAEQFFDSAFDAVIAPFRGGLAHGLLMRRATEPARGSPAVALWCDAPTRWLTLHDDTAPADIAPLVADALERSALRMADLLIGPHSAAFDRVRSLGELLPPLRAAVLPELGASNSQSRLSDPIRELVFVGPLSRTGGALVFMDAIERLAAAGRLDRIQVTFLGRAESPARGVGLDLLGVRAAHWPFRFRVETETDPAKTLAYLTQPGRLAVFAAIDADDDRVLRAALGAGGPVIAGAGYDVTREGGGARNVCGAGAGAWTETLQQALTGAAATTAPSPAATDWPKLVRDLIAIERRQPPAARPPVRSTGIGVLHHGRPDLRRALRSIPAGCSAAVVVIDNGSITPPRDLNGVASHVMRIEPAVTQPAAYNRFAAEAPSDVLIFLDDDNTFAPGGIRRLLDGFASGWFDVVVSTLDVVDGDPAVDASNGRFIFLGDAGMAGLFFNGFGDTAMAVRRDAFLRAGGFGDRGHLFSGLDWEFLARARAAGLTIGVLHTPAIRYARRIGTELREWRKSDIQGMRRAAAAAYGAALDAPLLARLAQGLQLAED